MKTTFTRKVVSGTLIDVGHNSMWHPPNSYSISSYGVVAPIVWNNAWCSMCSSGSHPDGQIAF